MQNKIYYTKPSITNLEVELARDAALNGWGESCYEYIDKFQEAFKAHIGAKHAIATSSCTGALHMGLKALNLSRGDEVILADINWVASVAPVVHLGATPIFVDILKDSWCLDPKKVEEAITSKTKAIIAVHIYGNLCKLDELIKIGNKYNIPVIEDSAEAIGSIYKTKRAGSIGLFGTFSFHGTKTITTGEGGILVTNNDDIYEKVLTLSNHGRARGESKQFWAECIGYKYKMSNIQAAIGYGQMKRIDELIKKKRDIYLQYKKAFLEFKNIKINPEEPGCVNGVWMPTLVFDKETELTFEKLQPIFKSNNIDARRFFWPLSSLPPFTRKENNIISYSISERGINLPSYHDITESDINRVVNIIKEQINK